MIQPAKTIHVAPGSELDQVLAEADEAVIELERAGVRYRLNRVDAVQGSPWLKELYAYFAPVRAEAEAKCYTDEQINAWIDEALAAVRREQHA